MRVEALSDPVCPECEGKLTPPRMFNLMFETHMGPVRSDENTVHLRPETAQGIFVNFANVVTATRRRPPIRHRPDRQGLPERDHHRQLHLPHPRVRDDGDRVLRTARRGRGVARALDRRVAPLVRGPRR